MSLEGLQSILEKQEVVPTFSAQDILERAETVEFDYLRHVRTYVPISRVAEGQKGELGVEDFEKRVIRQVKDARAPRGYLTAEYGYGKTSTALYLWQRAEAENLIAVPPFQMLELTDLVVATYGWVRHRLHNSRPHLVQPLDALYQSTIDRSLEKLSRERGYSIATLQSLVEEDRLRLELQPTDYIKFFEDVTQLVEQAGFEGLIVLPDEIQQYIEPSIKSRTGDPIAPFFNLVQGLASRAGYLRFGFIMIAPLKELAVIREARGRDDLLHRMKDLSLDLTNVYTVDFARNLWELLAQEFGFTDVKDEIICDETLDALGQIAARDDISNGPRTVINVFKRMVERYLNGEAKIAPYSPIDLADDFLAEGVIAFSGNDKIRTITRQALQSAIVRRDPQRYERAIKLAAAFPTEGVPRWLQRKYSVDAVIDELMAKAIGELVIAVGPGDEGGVTLSRLDRAEVATKWLPSTIRDFRRAYSEDHDVTRDRANEVFITILKNVVFKNWKVVEERPRTYTSNLSIVFEGDFQSTASNFPRRKVHARILWEDEPVKDASILGDIVIEYQLSLYRSSQERRQIAQPARLQLEQYKAIIPINLMYIRPEGVPAQIQIALQNVWSPYDISPLVRMNIYQMLEEKRRANLIPKDEDQYIKPGFQPDLLDSTVRDLFNPQMGAPLNAAGASITEVACKELLTARYGSTYHTMMAVTNWRSSLQKYENALERLEKPYQKRGDVEVEGTKDEIAHYFVLTNTALDSFIRNFPDLITVVQDFSREGGAVRFTLHPLEQQVLQWLRNSDEIEKVKVGGKQETVHALLISEVDRAARELGYQGDEIDEAVSLLGKRGMVEVHRQHRLREIPSQAPNLDEVTTQLRELENSLKTLLEGFPGNNQLENWMAQTERWHQLIEEMLRSGGVDVQKVHNLGRNITARQSELFNFAADRLNELQNQLAMLSRSLRPISMDRINTLSGSITGSVAYVDQVNALRVALDRQARIAKASVDEVNEQLQRTAKALSRNDLNYEELSHQAKALGQHQQRIIEANEQSNRFEQQFQQLSGWRDLVTNGSTLYDTLRQMEQMAAPQLAEFEQLASKIRGAISSTKDRLSVLPNFSIYTSQLADIAERVRIIRNEAVETFNTLQNRYRYALVNSGLYKQNQLDHSITYNYAAPDTSYEALFEEIANRLTDAHKRMGELARRQRQELLNILSTPMLQTLPAEAQQHIDREGNELLGQADNTLEHLKQADDFVSNLEVVRDFPASDEGQFSQLVSHLVTAQQMLATLDQAAKTLRNSIGEFELSPEENLMFEQLPAIANDEVDLVEWRKQLPQITDDDFWRNLRGLYEKRRVRLVVELVRR
jgi:hypothetical protein